MEWLEHALRYEHFANALNKEGYAVYAHDLRGHGKTLGSGIKGWIGEDGWKGVILDFKKLLEIMKEENPNTPLFLYGHSIGSIIAQDIIQQYGSLVSGVILSSTWGKQDLLLVSLILGRIIVLFRGKKREAGLYYKLGVEVCNKPFEPSNSSNSWISTLEEEVKKYDDDPLCGFKSTNDFFLETSKAIHRIWKKKNESLIPKELPIFMVSGSEDSVTNFTKYFMLLFNRYKKHGIKDLNYKIYQDARHETLNDFTRDEAISDIIKFLNDRI
ncbi:MAG: alpha/beta hydrolase [Candidatus Heimdallarchaeota archaeon]